MAEKWKAPKDPQDIKDYDLHWEDRLVDTEILSAVVWTITKVPEDNASNPLVIGGFTAFETTGLAKVWLSGGVKGTYNLLCHVTTNQTRQYDQTMILKVDNL